MPSHPTLRVFIPYGKDDSQNHFVDPLLDDEKTLCGRRIYGWTDLRAADLTEDLDSAYTCRRCARKAIG